MSGIKGWASQLKLLRAIVGYTDKQSVPTQEWATLQDLGKSDQFGLNVVPKGLFRLSAIETVEVGSDRRIILSTAHGASVGDVIRFEAGAANEYFEAPVLSVPDADTIILSTQLPLTPTITDTFYVMRYVTPRYLADGGSTSTGGSALANTLTGDQGITAIANGASTVTIAYAFAFATPTSYSLVPAIKNLVDATPIFLQIVDTVKTTTGATLTFNAPADSANYFVEWIAAVRNP